MEKRSCSNAWYPDFSEQIFPVSLLCFTQLSIAVRFSGAHNQSRIDDAVRDILANKLKPDDFPMLEVFHYEGFTWCLNNRRLWVFKKARVSLVTVRIVPQDLHKRRFESFVQDLTSRPELLSCMSKPDYFPQVRGKYQISFKVPRSNSTPVNVVSATVPSPSKVQGGSRVRLDQKALNAQYPVHSEQNLPVSLLCFTETSIGVHFPGAHQHFRIDDAVLQILANQLKPEDFPMLEVILYEGFIWSLDNRRLWVFRKACIPVVTVRIVPQNLHKKGVGSFLQELRSQPELLSHMTRYDFFPRVRGSCQKNFTAHLSNSTPVRVSSVTVSKVHDASRLLENSEFQATPVSSLSNPNTVQNIWSGSPPQNDGAARKPWFSKALHWGWSHVKHTIRSTFIYFAQKLCTGARHLLRQANWKHGVFLLLLLLCWRLRRIHMVYCIIGYDFIYCKISYGHGQ